MEQIIVTHRNGSTVKLNSKENVSGMSKATQTVELLGSDIVDISLVSAKKLDFFLGDKITIIGRDYTLNTPAKERKISESNFAYDLQFEGVQYDLMRASFNVNVDTTTNEIQDISGDSITGNIKIFLDVLVSNANRVFGSGKWEVGTYPSDNKTLNLSFGSADNCLSVLQNLCSEANFNTEFKIVIDGSGKRTINIGVFGNNFTHTFEYGKGNGIFELTREKVSSTNIINRLNSFGGTKNIITPKYRADKLCLATKSKAQSFIEDTASIADFGIWEATKEFNDIFPKRTGVISALGSDIFEFIDASMDFDLNATNPDKTFQYLMEGTTAKITVTTGNLAGYEFEVSKYDTATKKFTIISQTDENDFKFPSPTSAAFQFAIGDEYILTDIYMPQSYIDSAEALLLTKSTEYLERYSQPLVKYSLTIDSNFLRDQVGSGADSNIVWVGDYVPIKDVDLNVDKTIRVKGFSRDLLRDYTYNITIADLSTTVNIINRVVNDVNGINNVIKINNLKDPAKARRNWKDAQEVLNMIFDVEGDYYTDKIKPLSIDTSMLSVGAKSMQFGLEGTIFQPNYQGNKNRVVYVGGILTHYAVLDSDNLPRFWNIADGDVVITDDTARYVYAKCERSTSAATILFSADKITVEQDGANYHFLIGVLNSVDVSNTRALALMYGFTTVNGRYIRTGRIQSADATTYFDLDNNEIGGKIFFKDGLVSGLIGVGENVASVNAGMSGTGTDGTSIRFWAGETADNKETAPFRVDDNGKVFMSNAEIEGEFAATTGKVGNWVIAGGGIFNDTDDAYIIARKNGVGGTVEARIGSNVVSASTGQQIPAWFINNVDNYLGENVSLLLTANNGNKNKAIQAIGDIVLANGDAISSKQNYMNLFVGSPNVIEISRGSKVHVNNTSGANRTLYLPSLTEIRDYLRIGTFSVDAALDQLSTTATNYYIKKGSGLSVGDSIKYGASVYRTVISIDRSSSAYDQIFLDLTIGQAVSSFGSFTAINEFSVEIMIHGNPSVFQNFIQVFPNGATLYDNNGGSVSFLNMAAGDILRILCYTRKNVMYYQVVLYAA